MSLSKYLSNSTLYKKIFDECFKQDRFEKTSIKSHNEIKSMVQEYNLEIKTIQQKSDEEIRQIEKNTKKKKI